MPFCETMLVWTAEAVADVGDVADVNRRAVDLLDREVVQSVEDVGAAVQPDVVFAVADLLRAGGEDDVLRVERVRSRPPGEAFAEEFLRIDIDHDLARLSAVGQGNLRALHGGELGADEVEAEIVKLLLGQRVAGQSEMENGNVGRADIE